MKQFAENSYGDLFAITGIYDEGDGVFYSEDEGATWQTRNNGLGIHLGCDKIAVDKNNRLYLLVSDENTLGYGGLFISEISGLSWEKVSISIDSVGSAVRIGTSTNLSVLPNDSIYLSFYGSGGNYAVELNICKSINDIDKSSSWKLLHLKHNQTWGMDDAMNNIHVSKKGDWFSSTSGSVNHAGTCFRKKGETNWEILDYGLGTDTLSGRSEQFFAETQAGKIFMVQYLDERIYKTDKSLTTNSREPVKKPDPIHVFPNPVRKGEKLSIQIPENGNDVELSLYDLTGKKIYFAPVFNNLTEINAPSKEGIYILTVEKYNSKRTTKITVF